MIFFRRSKHRTEKHIPSERADADGAGEPDRKLSLTLRQASRLVCNLLPGGSKEHSPHDGV